MSVFSVVYDANVLYPAPLRDLLMHLAMTDLFRAKWSQSIHEEWIENLLENRKDLTRERLERTRHLMDENVRDALVEGYEPLINSLELPDPDDRHILAAAIRAGAQVILTINIKDFPEEYLKTFGIEAQHPDEFITGLIDLDSHKVCKAVCRHFDSLKNPPKTEEEYIDTIYRQGLPMTARWIAEDCLRVG